jgi:hypothetical protein
MTARLIERTQAHRRRVSEHLSVCQQILSLRAERHDKSKLEEPELGGFVSTQDRWAGVVYGTPEYQTLCDEIAPTIAHHYAHNDHHPEHYERGVSEMNLLQVLEMLCDWMAVSEEKRESVLLKLPVLIAKHGIGEQLASVLFATADELEGLQVNTGPEPSDDPGPHGECRAEIEHLKAQLSEAAAAWEFNARRAERAEAALAERESIERRDLRAVAESWRMELVHTEALLDDARMDLSNASFDAPLLAICEGLLRDLVAGIELAEGPGGVYYATADEHGYSCPEGRECRCGRATLDSALLEARKCLKACEPEEEASE